MEKKAKAYLLIAKDVFNMSDREIAEHLGLTLNGLRSRASRGTAVDLTVKEFDSLEKAIQAKIDQMNQLIEEAK